MPTSATDLAIGLAITLVFLAPALAWPTLGRALLSVFFIGGATFNLLYTLPNLPASLDALVATSTIPLYREVVELAVAWHVGAALIALVIAFEATAGALTLWRGPLARAALLLAAAWGLAMLPVIPPYGLPIGVALTGAPALAALVLFRKRYPESVFRLVGRRLVTAHPIRPPARASAAPTGRNTRSSTSTFSARPSSG